MKNNIKINKLNLSYSKVKVFEDFDLEISDQNISIIGTPASGKTSLVKLLGGLLYSESVTILNLKVTMKNQLDLRKIIGVVLNDFAFVAETVSNELTFGMENLCYSNEEMNSRLQIVTKFFNLESLLNSDPNTLSNEYKTIIKIVSFILMDPKIIIIDDLLCNLTYTNKCMLIEFIKNKNIQIINVTSNIDETLFTDYIIVLDKGKIAIEGKTDSVLNEELILKRLGFGLPFIVDLSKQLISYELINKTCYDLEELVGELWK